ncbi:MAG: M67 family metallopeptidase [Clostridiales bacterium]|jgi:proteasome lid subunit RPN8/RPN11|nr:M67 family metallopeptidase [Clostridiales bacterium]
MLILSVKAEQGIKSEGEASYPKECCGALLGRDAPDGRVIERIIPIANQFEEGEQHHRFCIEADDILKAELAAREIGMETLGFYHSHPDCPAVPSEYDRAHALPFYSYLIASVEQGETKGVRAWELSADRSEFWEKDIVIDNE